MTDSQRTVLTVYVREVADIIGLAEWRISISEDDPIQSDWMASNSKAECCKKATLSFSQEFFDQTQMDQVVTVIHELLHLHIDAILDPVRVDLHQNRIVSHDVYNMLYDNCYRLREYAIENLSWALAKMFPLIEWGGKDE